MVVSSAFYTACTVLYAIYYKKDIQRDMSTLDARAVWFLAFTSIVCAFITNVLYFRILKKYDSHIISALIYSCPVFTLILAYLILKERVTLNGFLGVVFITIGVVLLAFNQTGDEPFGLKH